MQTHPPGQDVLVSFESGHETVDSAAAPPRVSSSQRKKRFQSARSSPLQSQSVVGATAEIVDFLHDEIGLTNSFADMRASALVDAGFYPVKRVQQMTNEQLEQHGGFNTGELQKFSDF